MKLIGVKPARYLLMIFGMFTAYMTYLWIEAILFWDGKFSGNVNSINEGWIEVIILASISLLALNNAVKLK